MRFLVTGANGFVGQHLCAELLRQGQSVRAAVRSADSPVDNVTVPASRRTLAADWIPAFAGMTKEVVVVGAIDGETNWADALRDVDVVIHLAARVHVMKDAVANPLGEFLKVNMQGTANLAYQAAAAGVKRLVYVSSIKVNGEETLPPLPSPPPQGGREFFREEDAPNPQDPYGASKWQAEQVLHHIAQETGLEVVIVRPPLVYGPGVKGNFAQMLKVLNREIPLPLSAVNNLRSFIYVENLVDALIVCAERPSAAGKTYLVSDGEDVSTPDLLRRLGCAMGHPARLFPLPIWLLKLGGMLFGKAEQVERLLGSLLVDDGKIRRELGWQPPYTLEQGLHATAVAFAANR